MIDHDARLARWGESARSAGGAAPPSLEDLHRRTERRRARRRRNVVGFATIALAIAAVGAALALDSADDGGLGVVSVTTTTEAPRDVPIVESIDGAVEDGIELRHDANLEPGDPIEIIAEPGVVGDPYNDAPRLCFDWGDARTCDPSAWEQYETPSITDDRIVWNRPADGWVATPGGLRPCPEVRCVVLVTAEDGAPHISAPIDVDPGPRPEEPASIERIGDDGSMVIRLESTEPDPSWTAWAAGKEAERLAGFPAFGIARCAAVGTRWSCDALHPLPAVPTSGGPATLTLSAARDLFTPLQPDPWVDCARFACAVAISRTIGVVESPGGSTGSSDEVVAWLPYRVPATARHTVRPTMTVEPPGPWRAGQEVTVTVHHPGIARSRLQLGQCSSDDLRIEEDCGYHFRPWTGAGTDRSTTTHRVIACGRADGCYLALTGIGGKGYPAIARTARQQVES